MKSLTLIRLILSLLIYSLPSCIAYNFKLEPSTFVGKGHIGDIGDFDNNGRLNYASYFYNSQNDRTTIYVYADNTRGELKADAKGDAKAKEEEAPADSGQARSGTIKLDGGNREFDVSGQCDGLMAADMDSNGTLDILLVMKSKELGKENNFYLLIFFQNDQGKFINAWDSRTDIDVLFNALDPDPSDVQSKAGQDSSGGDSKTKTESKSVTGPTHEWVRSLKPSAFETGQYEVTSVHPLVADFDGDGYFDILVQTADFRLFFWMNYGKVFLPFSLSKVPSVRFEGEPGGIIPNPHSSAFIDMNGDCRPDLVLNVEDNTLGPLIEIWIAKISDDKLSYVRMEQTIKLPPIYGMVTFNDFDSDGTNDLLVPFCDAVDADGFCTTPTAQSSQAGEGGQGGSAAKDPNASAPKFGIIYNHQMPFCPQMMRSGEEECRHPDNLCIPSNMSFTGYAEDVVSLGADRQFLYPLRSVGTNIFKQNKVRKHTTQLARVTAADFNNKSMLDFVVPLLETNPKDGAKKHVVVVVKTKDKARTHIVVELKDPNLVITHATAADIMDRRMLNLMVFTTTDKTLNCFYYSLHRETIDLFMKVMTKHKNMDESKYPDTYFLSGSSSNGLSYKLTVIDIHGMKNARTASLRPQTAYSPLYTPFAFIGLGKTNNYVEELYLGVASAHKNYFHMWISIIPSCTAITLPIPLDNPTQWTLKLSIMPGKKLFTILLSTSIALIIFGIVILIFDVREKREDYVRAKGFRQKFIIN